MGVSGPSLLIESTDSMIHIMYLQVAVSPGMKHEQRIPFRGEADQMVSDGTTNLVLYIHVL